MSKLSIYETDVIGLDSKTWQSLRELESSFESAEIQEAIAQDETQDQIVLVRRNRDSLRFSFNGVEFWATKSDNGGIGWCEDWAIIDQMMALGLVTRKFYRHLYGAERFFVKDFENF